jgi:hypothetical protein
LTICPVAISLVNEIDDHHRLAQDLNGILEGSHQGHAREGTGTLTGFNESGLNPSNFSGFLLSLIENALRPIAKALSLNASSLNALSLNALSLNALSLNASSLNALSLNALSLNASSLNALSLNALSLYASCLNALSLYASCLA